MRRMFRFAAALSGLIAVFSTTTLAQVASLETGGEGGRPCTPAGAWYGGSDGTIKYVAAITPMGDDRFLLTFDGAFDMSAAGFPVTTIMPGEFRKQRRGHWQYAGTALGLASTSTTLPPAEPPFVLVVRYRLRLEDCDTLKMQHDFFGAYPWGSRPLVDPPLFEPAPTPIDETYTRLPIG